MKEQNGIDRFFNEQKALVFLFVYWVITQCVIVYFFGIRTSYDSATYLQVASELNASWHISDGHDFWYLGYGLVLALLQRITSHLLLVVVVQIVFSGVALYSQYRLVEFVSGSRRAAFMAAFLYIFWFEIHTWNVFVYTESLFTSCTLIAFYLLVSARKNWHYAFAIFLILFTSLIRPTGFSFLVSVIIFSLARISIPVKSKGLAAVVLALLLMVLINKMLTTFDLIQSYAKGEIIYPNINFWIEKPESLLLPPDSMQPLASLIFFMAHNPAYFFKLSSVKMILYYGHVKPYFSWVHNTAIVLLLYPLYFLAGWAAWRSKINKPVLLFLLSYIFLQGATVMLTAENWDGRFLVPVLPFVFVLSALGLDHLLKQKKLVE